MSIRRACSYTGTFTLPDAAESYNALVVAISQNKQLIIKKTKPDLELSGNDAVVKLTQEETLRLIADTPAQLQIRAYKSAYEAPGSKIFTVDVYPSIDEEVLS